MATTNKFEIDLLCFDINNSCPFQDDSNKFANVLQGNKKLFSSNAKVELSKVSDKEGQISIEIHKPDGLANLDYVTIYYVRCILNIPEEEVDSFRKELVEYLKKQGFGKIYITRDDLSQEFLTRLYPKINAVENRLRSYITKHLSIKEGVSSWFNRSIKNEAKEKVNKRKSNENIFSDKNHEVVDTQICLLDFEDLGEIIYANYLGNLKAEDLRDQIARADNLQTLKSNTQKYIDKYFEKFKDVNFQEKWDFLKPIRHKVAHNGFTDLEEYEKACATIDELQVFLKDADENIIKTSSIETLEKEYVDIDDVRKYRSSYQSQYEPITKNELLRELKNYQSWCKSVGREFLGLKNFLHNRLGGMGYHIGKAWDMLEELESEGYIKIATWQDPKNIYPKQKAIEVLRDLPVFVV